MTCCAQFDKLLDRDLARHAQPYQLSNGTIITEIDTEYFLGFGEDRHQFVGVNYCPFCGRVLSRELWNLEKKKSAASHLPQCGYAIKILEEVAPEKGFYLDAAALASSG